MKNIIVIGGGPAGYVAAIRAAQLGGNVTLIEKDALGGTCLNTGCIPTKSLLHSAKLFADAKNGAQYGVIADPKLDFAKVISYKADVTQKLVKGIAGLMQHNKITVIAGEARFTGEKEVAVASPGGVQTITADGIIIAAGSLPAFPPIPGTGGGHCIDSAGALALEKVPASMAIIGGGVIGVELAAAYRAFGAQITVIEMLPEILPMFDADMTAHVKRGLTRAGCKILTSAKVASIEEEAGFARVNVEAASGTQAIEAEKVLLAVGRRANTQPLALEAAGIVTERGRILADAFLQTNVKGVYAAGDCTGGTMLAHAASLQGEVAAENVMGQNTRYDEDACPSCVYGSPELAMCGMTEARAKECGLDYTVGKFMLGANGKAVIENGGLGAVKILAGARDEILGVCIAGPGATELIAEAALAVKMRLTVDDLIHTIHAHPTVAESLREAGLAAKKRAIHAINR